MIEVFLVDDEQRALDALAKVLTSFFDDVHICGTASNVADAHAGIIKTRPQLVFLDVEMGAESGFDLLEKFDKIDFHVAFVTAHEEFALRAIKFSALDYIVKPAGVDDLEKLLQKVEAQGQAPRQDLRVKHMFGNFTAPDKAEHKISIPVVDGYEFIMVKEIMYICAAKSYSEIHLHNGGKFVSSRNVGFFEEVLHSYGFFRIHKSTLVNLKYIKSYRRSEGGYVTMKDGEQFGIARTRKDELARLLSMR